MIRAFLRRLLRNRVTELVDAELGPMPHPGMPDGVTWPGEYCAWPPCEWEADYVCSQHQPRGRHHAEPLTYSPVPPSVHDISSLGEWR